VKPSSPHEPFLWYRSGRWAKLSALLLLVAVAAYLYSDPAPERRGDTVVGYALGIVSAALIVWLLWFGVRKRRYVPGGAPLRGWLSAHVWLGLTLLLLVPIHCAFIFGWNVHTLAYVLMALVIVSGMVGVYFYEALPGRMTENRPGVMMKALLDQVAEIDRTCRELAQGLPNEFANAVTLSVEETWYGGGVLTQLRGSSRGGTARALEIVAKQSAAVQGASAISVAKLGAELKRKHRVVEQIRGDIRMKGLLDLWLVVHVPLAIATAFAVLVHVFVVLYW
jgi:hypothetical protein